MYLSPANIEAFPFRHARRHGSVAAAFLILLLTLSVGAPASGQDPASAVEAVNLGEPPPNGVHIRGSRIVVNVVVDRDVVISGQPRFALTIGADTQYAEFTGFPGHYPSSWPFVFEYVVQASDRDDDGVSIPANALSLDGGSIEDTVGNDVDLSHDAIPDDPDHKVNGSLVPPAPVVETVRLVNPPSDGVHIFGDTVEAEVWFDRGGSPPVTGAARLALTIGAETRYAEHRSTGYSGSRGFLGFRYVVQASDRDDDGISIPANAISVGGGSITDAAGNDYDLRHDPVPDDPLHKVDGSVDLPPVVIDLGFGFLGGEGTLGPGQRIDARMQFSEPVVVTGNPGLALRIGDQTREADLQQVYGDRAHFQYYVQASDRDDDGVVIPANAVRLKGGAIRDSAGQDADLTHEAVDSGPRVGRVDGVPTITGVLPYPGDASGPGRPVIVDVDFSEPVEVTGSPQLAMQVGTETRQADLHILGTASLTFEYVLQFSDVGAVGFGVPADALTLNGGSIRDADGNDADLSHEALPYDPDYQVSGSGPPTVSEVWFGGEPANQDAYEAGESIVAFVFFTRGVRVTGAPQLALQVGARARRADHIPLREAAGLLPPGNSFHLLTDLDHLVPFRYVVQPSDVDEDGVGVPADALTLNGGSIRAVDDDSDADLSHAGEQDYWPVDGGRIDEHAPVLDSLEIDRPVRGVFGRGDAITVELYWNELVTVTGAPRLALRIGTETRFARFREQVAGIVSVFEYVVDESDRDDDGISIAGDAIDLNGGTIRDEAGNDAIPDLGYHAFDNHPHYKVNGGLTPVPALPWAGGIALLLALLGGGWRRLARGQDHSRH